MNFDFFNPRPISCAPFLGTGWISLQIGPAGSMNNVGGGMIIKSNPSRAIWWEGRRYVGDQTKPLIPFGRSSPQYGHVYR